MARDIDVLLARMLAQADGKEEEEGVGTVYTGPSSSVRNAQDLVGELKVSAPIGDWTPDQTFTDPNCPLWVWCAEDAVTDQNGEVTAWPARYYPGSSAPDATPVNGPTLENDVFGRGARHFPAAAPGEPWLCRCDVYVTKPLLMGWPEGDSTPRCHTIIFWVYPETVPEAQEERTICCAWTNASDKRSYWLGLVGDQDGAKFTYRASWDGQAEHVVQVQSDPAEVDVEPGKWYRVVAQFDPDGENGPQLRLGVGKGTGTVLEWADEAYEHDRIHGADDDEFENQFQIGGAPNIPHRVWDGRITHGYYYKSAISESAINALVGQGVSAPVAFDSLSESQTADLESMWALDERSCRYVYDEMGNNNMHWAFWVIGSAPITDGYPGVRLDRSETQHFTCDEVASSFAGTNVPMTLFMVTRLLTPRTSGAVDGLVGLGYSASSMPYRMWCHYRAYHRDYNAAWEPPSLDKTADLYEGSEQETEAVVPQMMGMFDAAAHVLCTVWGPYTDGSGQHPYGVALYVDDPINPATATQDMGDLREMPFNRFTIGAVRRGGDDVIYPTDGYIGAVAVIKKALTSWERVLMMQWLRNLVGLSG